MLVIKIPKTEETKRHEDAVADGHDVLRHVIGAVKSAENPSGLDVQIVST